ncbi:DUF6438 domain-containing protein [Novosphingobium sp. FKTRR1]|uniref:DUF6438 domain-containing protein n=1 Tax=Novosphingobium sp. FKTRR1 TaxID=2879118 RepID=UPI001CF0A0E4|nr:DUF6438 domain-containing protein [Novosphingobium sp. FKTRR1]
MSRPTTQQRWFSLIMRAIWRARPGAVAILILSACSAQARLPEVDYTKLRITLTRSACFGTCPDYRLVIRGDGLVEFSTQEQAVDGVAHRHRQNSAAAFVRVTGKHFARIDRAQIDALLQQFREGNFFALKGEYRASVTDSPTYVVSIDTGNGAKRVIDYVGREVGMPQAVTDIENAIDATAGSRRWIEGTAEVIPLLQAEGTRFDGPVGAQLMLAAAARGDLDMMARLQHLGVAPDASDPLEIAAAREQPTALSWLLDHGAGKRQSDLRNALRAAIQSDSQGSYDVIRARVDPAAITSDAATVMLRMAAGNGNAAMVAWLLTLHPEVDGYDQATAQKTALFEAASGSCSDDRAKAKCDRAGVVRMLLDAGADPVLTRSDYRQSVLQFVGDANVARMLLKAGADPNYRDDDGEPVIFSIDDEATALALIDAGMKLNAVRPADKMTLRGWARYQKWLHVLALLRRAGL